MCFWTVKNSREDEQKRWVMETYRLPPIRRRLIVFNCAFGEKRAKESGLTVHGYGCLCCSCLSAGNKHKQSDIRDFRIRRAGRSCGFNPFIRRVFFVFSWRQKTPIYKRGFSQLDSSLIYEDHMFKKKQHFTGTFKHKLLFAAADGLAPEFTWTWIVSKPDCAVLKLSRNDFDATERSVYHLLWILNRLRSFSFLLWSAFNSVCGNFS